MRPLDANVRNIWANDPFWHICAASILWNILDAVKILWYVFVLFYTMYPSSSATFAHRGEAIWGRLGTKNTENTDSVCVSICCMKDLGVDKHLFWSAVHYNLKSTGCPKNWVFFLVCLFLKRHIKYCSAS